MARIAAVEMETLADLALKKLKECKGSLGDIGDAPLGLLEPVLVACDADGLDRIETSTARGHSGRDLSMDTWPLWYRFVKESMKTTLKKNEILKGIDRRMYATVGGDTGKGRKVNDLTPLRHLVSPSVPPLDYKRLYKDVEKRKKERLVKKGEALRAKFRDLKEEKLSRCVHVLDHAASRIAKHRTSVSRGKRKQASMSSSTSTNTSMNQDVKSNRQGTMHRLSQKLGIQPPPASQTAHEQFIQRAQKRSMIRRHCQPKKVLPTAGQLRSPSSTGPRGHTARLVSGKQSGNRKHTLSSASIFDS